MCPVYTRFSKVTRCKSGTNISRYRRNGYVLGLIQDPRRLQGRHREQVESSHRPSHMFTESDPTNDQGIKLLKADN